MHTPVLALHEMGIKQVAVPQAAMLEWPADLVKDAKLLNVSMNSNLISNQLLLWNRIW